MSIGLMILAVIVFVTTRSQTKEDNTILTEVNLKTFNLSIVGGYALSIFLIIGTVILLFV